MLYRVEGLPYPTKAQAEVVAERFARRYGREVHIRDDRGVIKGFACGKTFKVQWLDKPAKV
jgi:hypothetical protein